MASGRSDYPNQINNVLAFPGVFRGLLDARATEITVDMLLRAATAIAHVGRRRRAQPDVHHPDGLQHRRAQGRGGGDPRRLIGSGSDRPPVGSPAVVPVAISGQGAGDSVASSGLTSTKTAGRKSTNLLRARLAARSFLARTVTS